MDCTPIQSVLLMILDLSLASSLLLLIPVTSLLQCGARNFKYISALHLKKSWYLINCPPPPSINQPTKIQLPSTFLSFFFFLKEETNIIFWGIVLMSNPMKVRLWLCWIMLDAVFFGDCTWLLASAVGWRGCGLAKQYESVLHRLKCCFQAVILPFSLSAPFKWARKPCCFLLIIYTLWENTLIKRISCLSFTSFSAS